jgi:cytochrome c biogenesis protein
VAAGRTAVTRSPFRNPIWRLLTSVDFAVVQIIVIALMLLVGMTLRQMPGFAFRSASDYADEMARIHQRYDPAIGADGVATLERLGAFQVFTSVWFSAALALLFVSIVACTLDRLPRLWRQVAVVRVVQPEPFYDPRLPDRATMDGLSGAAVADALGRAGFHVRRSESSGDSHLLGERHRYSKLATLLTHAGLVLFILAAAVTSRLGNEVGLLIAEGESTTVLPIGAPDQLSVKNLGFEAPGLDSGQAMDFTTELAVYKAGEEIARKTVRVNDPLSVAGWTFHENGFGPAPLVVVRDREGRPLWDGPVPMTDQAAGLPYAQLSVPGRDLGLQLLLDKADDGTAILVVLPYRVVGTEADGSPRIQELFPLAVATGETETNASIDFAVGLRGVSDHVIVIAKRDPGQGLVWLAFGLLIVGLVVSFYLPRRRVWARVRPDGSTSLVWSSDRYVDAEREFGALLDDLVARRAPGPA